MISRFLKKLSVSKRAFRGFRVVSTEEAIAAEESAVKLADALAKNYEKDSELRELRHKVRNLETTISINDSLRAKEIIDVFMADPSPVDAEQRKLYVAQVAGLHKDILEPKLKHMISKALNILEDSTNDREYDQAVKGTVYALREMIRWGNAMVNEQLASQNPEKN